MNLRSVPIEAVTKEHLCSLVVEGVAELRSIECKRELPGEDYEDKKECLADVSSFANTGGGDIVFGIAETGGAGMGEVLEQPATEHHIELTVRR